MRKKKYRLSSIFLSDELGDYIDSHTENKTKIIEKFIFFYKNNNIDTIEGQQNYLVELQKKFAELSKKDSFYSELLEPISKILAVYSRNGNR